jgi:hypothetical protein
MAGVMLAVLIVSIGLEPSENGYGTHRQLGQPACRTLVTSGYPCPACGMTTAFSAMVHGRFALAFRAQPFGVVLFGLMLAGGTVGGLEAVTGRDLLGRLGIRLWWLWVLLGLWAAGWGAKVALGVARGEYPLGQH